MSLTSVIIKAFDDLQNYRIKGLKLILINYNFQLKYILKKSNVIGDFLSELNIETNKRKDLSMVDVVLGIHNI